MWIELTVLLKSMDTVERLKSAGLVATKQRITLLERLTNASRPLSVEELSKKMQQHMNMTTVYRALDQLVEAGLVRRLDLRDNHARYEVAGKHHHHVVCTSCGDVADVSVCLPRSFFTRVRTSQKQFATIEDHALEFFGTCVQCT